MTDSAASFESDLAACRRETEAVIDALLSRAPPDLRTLEQAMRYSVLSGGKRLRAFLLIEAAKICGGDGKAALPSAAALEMLHGYSLIHDDLPAMDDDCLRHGKPCLHLAYDEATAILAGDALLTYAFEILASDECHPDLSVRLELIKILSHAAGFCGMAGGQFLDMQTGSAQKSDFEQIARLQSLKTGALFVAATEMGAVLAGAPPESKHALKQYSAHIGLAFQMMDDWLDVKGDAAQMGKAVGKDAAQGKLSFLNLMPPDEVKQKTEQHIRTAAEIVTALNPEGCKALVSLAHFITARGA